jgi:hypothetical protein
MTTFGTADVLRFFGQAVPCEGKIPHRCRHEVSTSVRERAEGVRIKHWFNNNNLKMYDKGSVLRPECTVRAPECFTVMRAAEGDPQGPKSRRPLRRGIVDLAERAAVSQAANERYLEALAAVHLTTPLRELAEPLCRPSVDVGPRLTATPAAASAALAASAARSAPALAAEPSRASARPRRVRALNPLATDDARLLEAVSRHEFMINGLRNRDLRSLLFGEAPTSAGEQRQRSAAVTRKLRLLRAHGLLEKVPHSHRYLVSEQGRQAITALLAARNTSTEALIKQAS